MKFSLLSLEGCFNHPHNKDISRGKGRIRMHPNLSPVCPKLTHPIAKLGDLSIMFFEITDYILFQAKPVIIRALKRTLTDPFVQTISGPDDHEYGESEKKGFLAGRHFFKRIRKITFFPEIRFVI